MTGRRRLATRARHLPLLLPLAALGAGCAAEVATVRAQSSDRYPSTTASEWVTYGDFVGVVTVAEDRRAEPAQEELERGEGDIGRSVRFTVDEVVWQRPGSRQPPGTIVHPALGWQFRDGDLQDAAEVVAHDRPRFEAGHRYVVAFTWQPRLCYEGDGVIPPRWLGLGSGSALPFDGDVLGAGEFAGEERTIEEAEAHAAELPADSVAGQVTGEPLDALRGLLAEVKPGERGDHGPAPSDC